MPGDKHVPQFFDAFYRIVTAAAQRLPQPEAALIPNYILTSISQLAVRVEQALDRIVGILEGFERNQTRGMVVQRRTMDARFFNQSASPANPQLIPIPSFTGDVPVGFPETIQALGQLEGQILTSLLQTYLLTVDGTEHECRIRLARYIVCKML
ncbi:hypothetical protein FRC08_010682 [Ceratobasidium sp. 394]|nr:hypothetical protein FRC08_010682 [Ceratobasidium sp. 394]